MTPSFLSRTLFSLVVCLIFATPSLLAGTRTEVLEAESCPASLTAAITWHPKEVTCPVCQTKNVFMFWGSYGNYIYQFPSKYQLVYWPFTDSPAWHSCKKCKFTAFMEEFGSVPPEKLADLRKELEKVSLPPQPNRSEKESLEKPPYLDLDVSARLVVAETVYKTLGRGDGFWAHFYRVLGYHFEAEKKRTEADAARQKVVKIVEGWLNDKAKEGQRKEFLYIIGAMQHFLNDDAAATKSFEAAAKLTYANPEGKPENNKGYDVYLGELIKEYLDMLKKGAGPRTDPKKIA